MKSPRPKARPESSAAPKKSPRPRTRSDGEADAAFGRAMKHSQPDKMAKGGKCRGMGAATKGGKYSKSG